MTAMIAALGEMHKLGQGSPTAEMFRVNAVICLKSMLQTLPQSWVGDFEFRRLGPLEKKKFGDLVAGWSAMIETNIAARLGETKEEAA